MGFIVNAFRQVKTQYILFVATLIVTVAGSQLIIEYDLSMQNDDARLINLSGKQRMRSQQIAKLVLYIHHSLESNGRTSKARIDTLKAVTRTWERINTGLAKGSSEFGVSVHTSPFIDSLFRVITPIVSNISASVARLCDHPDLATSEKTIAIIEKNERTFRQNMEKIVSAYQAEAETKLKKAKITEWILGLITVCVIFLQFRLTFLPVIRRMERDTKSLASLNAELHGKNKELQSAEEELRSNLDYVQVLQEQAEAREKQFREVIENATDMIYELDELGKFSFVNPVMESMTGYTKEQLLTKGYWEIVDPAHVAEVVQFYKDQRHKRQESSYRELPVLTRSGERVWVGQNVRMFFRDQRVWKVSVIARDISDLKATQEKLIENEKLYRLLSTNSKDLITLYTADAEPKRLFVSPSVREILGYEPEELIGKSPFEIILEEDVARIRAVGLPLTLAGKPASVEYRARKKNGEIVWLQGNSHPIFDDHGKVTGFQTSDRDITDQKKAAMALLEAKEKAEEATQAKSQFLSMISHEIRTPMNAIIGLSNILLRDLPREDQLENLKLLKFSGENLLTIINDILDFSKIEAGKIFLESIDFDLKALLDNMVRMMEQRTEEKGIKINFKYDDDIPTIFKGDPVRIGQVITNLLSNAIKFTDRGYVELQVVLKEAKPSEAILSFFIRDTGIGIETEKLELIFERFAQASSETTRKFGGTGLGLAITRHLLKLMNTDIQVRSTPGKGSEFSFELRLNKGHLLLESPKVAHKEITDLSGKGIRVLLVEDNRVNQIVASNFLRNWKISVDFANHGKEALELIKSKAYHMVLMDLQMPEMDGYEASLMIRAMNGDAYFNKVPIIALTASAMVDTKVKVLASGINDIVTKPFNPEELHSKILQHISRELIVHKHTPPPGALDKYTEGDEGFKKDLSLSIIKNIHELDSALNETILTRNSETFLKCLHKIRPSIVMIDDPDFMKAIDSLKESISGKQVALADIQSQVLHLQQLSQKAITKLRQNLS